MRRLLVSVCLAALASCSAPAPHGDGGASPDAASSTIDGATGDAGPTCGEGELYCEGSCRSLAELAEDPDNCGACGARCGNVCREGSCREVVSISAGPTTTCAALSDGSVWCWGSNVVRRARDARAHA
ncbi:MAG: RCC1 domain-containing protein [Sandaracinaceae bacterium]|nr:RCC1 domain-containing protein [Sandaracinaceae bacterium]